MKLNKKYIVTIMFLFILAVQTGCQQKLPDGFPTKLVPFDVKLTHNGSPVKWAAVSFLLEGGNSPYLVTAYTNAGGVAKMETTMNVFSKSGVPSGTYMVIVTHTPEPPSKLANAELGKMSDAEITAYRKKIDAEIAAMPHPVPKEWGNIKTTPVKITVSEKGGTITIEIADPQTHQQ
ncbi:MAG: hypothetical protein LBL62_11735 [Planctomycetaceae bacterium]|jgi:hypothetical protein|nr:hypothetical protein [Planctomycetaceae bacterium]